MRSPESYFDSWAITELLGEGPFSQPLCLTEPRLYDIGAPPLDAQDEIHLLVDRLHFIARQWEANMLEARAAGDRPRVRRIRLFLLEILRRERLWTAPSARPR